MSRSDFLKKYLPVFILISVLACLYFASLAPDITWANSGSDGGDLITAAATRGIAHPTGYPVYLILARGFQFLPIGSLAYRTNLISALATVFASGLVYVITNRQLKEQGNPFHWLGGLGAGLAFGLASVVWSQAVIAEVYGLQALFIAALLYLLTFPGKFYYPIFVGFVFGLALGNHLITVLLLPLLILYPLNARWEQAGSFAFFRIETFSAEFKKELRFLSFVFLGTMAGLLAYFILPVRSMSHPPLNWGNPATWEGFWWLVSGQMYRGYLSFSIPGVFERIRAWAALLLDQFGIPGLVLSFTGLAYFFRRSVLIRNTIWISVIFSIFAIFYSSRDSYVYLIPVFMCFSIWLGIGFGELAQKIGSRSRAWLGVFAVSFFIYLALSAVLIYPRVDASKDDRAVKFGREVLSRAPENALVFAKGDNAVFTLWYYHFALRERTDLAIIASDLLQYSWYWETLKNTYPNLILTEPYPWPETVIAQNPDRPVCYVRSTDINCLAEKAP